ncbi:MULTISPECIES: hypothetical protein [Thermus]|uniref:Agd3-related carbohydrate-binding protein n=1 Tax=Thermus TaxID=270 RepID=UPI0003743AAF|nr:MULTISPECIES: hypothetical protein [Thermus]KHG64387.1 hypothetical protein QT17_12630 [Thermus sp. 2.9]
MRRLALLALLLAACSFQGPSSQAPKVQVKGPPLAPPALPVLPSRPLPALEGPVPLTLPLRPQALPGAKYEARILVLTTSTDPEQAPHFAAAQDILETFLIPYEVVNVSQTPFSQVPLTNPDGTGRFQGVILAEGQLATWSDSGPTYHMSADDWNRLWAYERDYGVRELVLYTYPGTYPEDHCLSNVAGFLTPSPAAYDPNGIDLATQSYPLTLTQEGQTLFPDLTGTLPLRHAYAYKATLSGTCAATPLLTDADGNLFGIVRATADGREQLVLTFDQSPYLVHTWLLAPGLIRWLTRGVYVGEYSRYLRVDVDDWFLSTEVSGDSSGVGNTLTFRLSGAEAQAVAAKQAILRQTYPVAQAFTLDLAFNGCGAVLDPNPNDNQDPCDPSETLAQEPLNLADDLVQASQALKDTFRFYNHSYTHWDMDFTDLAQAEREIAENNRVASLLGLRYEHTVFKSGQYSGFGWKGQNPYDFPRTDNGLGASNPFFLQALAEYKVRFAKINWSVDSQKPPCRTCAYPHPLAPGLYLVADRPTNVFYNVTTAQEALAAYNSVYGPGGTDPYWPRDLTYAEYLQQETNLALWHLFTDGGSHYFHQANLHEYAPGKNLVFDWVETLVAKYATYTALPLLSPTWGEYGEHALKRYRHYEAVRTGSVKALIDPAARTLTLQGKPVWVTGVQGPACEAYAGVNRCFVGTGTYAFQTP